VRSTQRRDADQEVKHHGNNMKSKKSSDDKLIAYLIGVAIVFYTAFVAYNGLSMTVSRLQERTEWQGRFQQLCQEIDGQFNGVHCITKDNRLI